MMEKRDIQDYSNEIDLMQVFPILWKKKWIFVGTVLITVCLGIFFANYMPDIYRVSAAIEPGIIDVSPDNKYVYIDSVQNIKAKIDSDLYDKRLRDFLGTSIRRAKFRLKSDVPKNANIVTIYTETRKEDTEKSIQIVGQLIKEIQKDYVPVIERKRSEIAKKIIMRENEIKEIQVKKKDLDTQIAQARNDMNEFQEQFKSYQSSLTVLKAREKELANDILNSKNNSEKFIQGRELFLKQRSDSIDPYLASILYTSAIQQNISLSNELQKQFNELLMQIEEVNGRKIDALNSIGFKKIQIDQLELQKNEQLDVLIEQKNIEVQDLEKRSLYIQDIHILSNPSATINPIKPDRRMIFVSSSIVGCLLGIVISLLAGYSARKYNQ